jgi:lipopolysaccharide export system permease protein
MKLIDRYLTASLLVPLLYCLCAFTIIIIIHDLFDHLADFLEASTPLPDILMYYLFLLPSTLYLIMPVSILLGVLYCLSSLTKNNELTAMRASGISLSRIMLPFILTGLLATVGVGFIHETVEPWSKYWTDQFVRFQKKKGEITRDVTDNLAYKNNRDNRIWMIEEFNNRTFEMANLNVTQERTNGTIQARIHAERAQWLDGKWWLHNLIIQEFDEGGIPVRQVDEEGRFIGLTRTERVRVMGQFTETPREFVNETKQPEFLSAWELSNYLDTHRHLSRGTRARYRVDLHHRLATPWMCLVVTLLGIPFGAQTARKGALLGIALSLGLFFGYYFFINFGLWLGKNLYLPAWLAAWMPNLVFLGIGGVMVYRMR